MSWPASTTAETTRGKMASGSGGTMFPCISPIYLAMGSLAMRSLAVGNLAVGKSGGGLI
jgi:hypothetical protein